MRRFLFLLLIVCSLLGCRTTVTQEAGLDPAFFGSQLPQLTSDERGFWYVVVPHGTPLGAYAQIDKNDESKVFYAIPKGKRTAMILPISPNSYAFLDALRDGPVDAAFKDEPSALKPSDTIGWYENDALTWLGSAKPPASPQRTVLLAAGFDQDIRVSMWLRGTALFSDGKLTEVNTKDVGGMFVIPDGAPPAKLPSVVAYGTVDLADSTPLTVARVQGEVPPGFSSAYYLRPLAEKLNAHVLVYHRTRYNIVFSRVPRVENGLAIGVTEVPMLFSTNAEETRTGLLSMVDTLNGNYLTGLYGFTKTAPSTTGGVYGGQLRLVELAAAGGYVDWARFSILNNSMGVNADDAIYIARSHLFSGEIERAKDFIQRAMRVFATWRENDRLAGYGRANFLSSVVLQREGAYEEALQASLRSAQFYAEGGDELRAGEAERRSAFLATLVGKTDIAIRAGSLARSRFYHGNSKYESGIAEIELSDIYRATGDSEKSEEMLKFAKARFTNLAQNSAALRADIADARARSDVGYLETALDDAFRSGDIVAASDAAASLVALGGDAPRTAEILAGALTSIDNPFLRHRVRASMDALCAQGVAKDDSPIIIQRACNVEAGPTIAKPLVTTGPTIARGYDALLQNDLETANKVLVELRGAISEDLRQRDAMRVVEIVLFHASVAKAENADPMVQVGEAVDTLRKSVDPTKLAETLDGLSDAAVARGESWLAIELLARASRAAEAQGQNEVLRELSLKRIETAYRASAWSELTEAIRVGDPVFQRAGDRAPGLLAISGFYHSIALTRSGKSSEGAKASLDAEKYLEKAQPADAVRALVIGAELAADASDTKRANQLVARGKETLAGAARGLIPEADAAVFNVEFDFILANVRANSGDSKGAYVAYRKSYETVVEYSDARSARLQVAALKGAGKTAPDTTAIKWVITELERQRRVKPDPRIVWTLGEIELLSGSPDRARKLVNVDVKADIEAVCLSSRALALVGKIEEAKAGLTRCKSEGSTLERFEAKVLDAIAGPSTLAEKRARLEAIQTGMDQRLPDRAKQQISLAIELLTFKASDAKREAALKKSVTDAKTPKAIRAQAEKAVVGLSEYGQPVDALAVLDTDAVRGAFYEKEVYQPALIRLRTYAMARAMRPVKAMNYGYQVADVVEPSTSPDDAAATYLNVAKVDLVVGLWHHGRTMLRDAYEASKSGKNRALRKEIEALAKRFDITLT